MIGDHECSKYWGEAKHIPIDRALDYWCEVSEPHCREPKKQAIFGACEAGRISYIRIDGKPFNDPVLRLYEQNALLISADDFYRWAEELDRREGNTEPDYQHYARQPYLTLKECACLLAGFDPDLYQIEIHDGFGNHVETENKLPAPDVEKIDKLKELVYRSTGEVGGISAHGKKPYTKPFHTECHYGLDEFIRWADSINQPLKKEFINSVEKIRDKALQSVVSTDQTPYLDKNHPCFSPRLFAAIKSWEYAVSQAGKNRTTPPQHIENWLDSNLSDLGFELSDKTKTALKTVSNYRAKTAPISEAERKELTSRLTTYQSRRREIELSASSYDDFDSDIPF